MSERENQHWLGLADLVESRQKRRVSALAGSKTKRSKLVSMFHHSLQFDGKFFIEVGTKGTERDVLNLLKGHGARDEVLVLNNSNECGGEWKTIGDAIGDCFGWCSGSVVSCIPGSLLFHESDEPELRGVVFRPTSAN